MRIIKISNTAWVTAGPIPLPSPFNCHTSHAYRYRFKSLYYFNEPTDSPLFLHLQCRKKQNDREQNRDGRTSVVRWSLSTRWNFRDASNPRGPSVLHSLQRVFRVFLVIAKQPEPWCSRSIPWKLAVSDGGDRSVGFTGPFVRVKWRSLIVLSARNCCRRCEKKSGGRGVRVNRNGNKNCARMRIGVRRNEGEGRIKKTVRTNGVLIYVSWWKIFPVFYRPFLRQKWSRLICVDSYIFNYFLNGKKLETFDIDKRTEQSEGMFSGRK